MTTWTRKQTFPGTIFSTQDGRVVVEQIEWAKPGFKNITSRGWVVTVDKQQWTPAHKTAKAAMEHAEQPGVWPLILASLKRFDTAGVH